VISVPGMKPGSIDETEEEEDLRQGEESRPVPLSILACSLARPSLTMQASRRMVSLDLPGLGW